MNRVSQLAEENEQLREELFKQWEYNHSEHCGQAILPNPHDKCCWPMPRILFMGSASEALQLRPVESAGSA